MDQTGLKQTDTKPKCVSTAEGSGELRRRNGRGHNLGNKIGALALRYGEKTNQTEIATGLRERTLSKDRYLGYISAIYPVVVGFNRGLMHSMLKVDHVRESVFLNALAAQLQEEQCHNRMWRTMLRVHGINHEALYCALEDYLARFTRAELDRMTLGVVVTLRDDLENVAPGIFPDPVFPEPVLALYHRMWMTGSDPKYAFWEHYAGQFGMEAMIFQFVTTSFYPGLVDHPELGTDDKKIRWWREHAKQGAEPGKKSDEEKHLELAKIALSRSPAANELAARVRATGEDAMRLLAATMICHDSDKGSFPIDPYRL